MGFLVIHTVCEERGDLKTQLPEPMQLPGLLWHFMNTWDPITTRKGNQQSLKTTHWLCCLQGIVGGLHHCKDSISVETGTARAQHSKMKRGYIKLMR